MHCPITQDAAVEAVAPILKAAMEALEERLMRLHAHSSFADVESGAEGGLVNTSAYVLQCSALVANFRCVCR